MLNNAHSEIDVAIANNNIGSINQPKLGSLEPILNTLIKDISATGETPEILKLLQQIEVGTQSVPRGNIRSSKYNVPPGFWSSSPTGPYLEGKEKFNPVEPITSDSGYYQFTKDSAKTAKQRAKNLGLEGDYIDSLSSDPTEWPKPVQDILALTNIAARSVKPGEPVEYFIDETGAQKYQGQAGSVNSLLKSLLPFAGVEGFDYTNLKDIEAFEDLYYTLHQTDPDASIARNVERGVTQRMIDIITEEGGNSIPDISDIIKYRTK